ncbi:hypothetical protein NP493_469g02030 [Ridgeia piscesae]|uniref:polo kinase n=1 Tax=Ridgeia piscesae TaxID=27915 RepID=A0AAD9KYV6_RIDPI|nr:hypothetical protein NP493_469g02030 [Ridgeia piscesae]
MVDQKSQKIYAGKIIAKNRLSKPHQKEKIIREIELHKDLSHTNVVAFHSFFEDDDYVYIILEVCTRKSLVHVLKNRKTLTEPEVRYYLRQLVEGCRYIHDQRIIHRDLKLGNMLLNDDMRVKIADFGLATRVEFDGERKMTVCGTPNYIAPEVLQKKGHSYEADLWAIGCIMYAMLIGRPPFETSTLKETYVRITSNKYYLPSHISTSARNLIQRLLSPEPSQRPSLEKILADEFFSAGYTPKTLSSSCCEWAPKYSVARILPRPKSYAAPVSPAEAIDKISNLVQIKGSRKAASQILTKTSHHSKETEFPSSKDLSSLAYTKRPASTEPRASQFGSSVRLYQMLSTCIDAMPADANPSPVPNPRPLWVTKWVDYSNKYGFGFQLADRSVGVLFNDSTRMLLAPDGRTVQYNDLSNRVYTFRTESAPADYQKKATLLLYFAQYMDEHLIHGGDATRDYGSWTPTGIFMKKWFRTDRAIVMYLNNGTLQVNFFGDHTKVILSPDSHDYLVTYINQQRVATTYHLLQVRHFGCHPEIVERLRYGKRVLEKIINVSGESV